MHVLCYLNCLKILEMRSKFSSCRLVALTGGNDLYVSLTCTHKPVVLYRSFTISHWHSAKKTINAFFFSVTFIIIAINILVLCHEFLQSTCTFISKKIPVTHIFHSLQMKDKFKFGYRQSVHKISKLCLKVRFSNRICWEKIKAATLIQQTTWIL